MNGDDEWTVRTKIPNKERHPRACSGDPCVLELLSLVWDCRAIACRPGNDGLFHSGY